MAFFYHYIIGRCETALCYLIIICTTIYKLNVRKQFRCTKLLEASCDAQLFGKGFY